MDLTTSIPLTTWDQRTGRTHQLKYPSPRAGVFFHQTYQLHVLSWLRMHSSSKNQNNHSFRGGSRAPGTLRTMSCFNVVSRDAANHAGDKLCWAKNFKGVSWCLKKQKTHRLLYNHNLILNTSQGYHPIGFFHHEHPSPETVLASSQSSNITTLRPSPHRETQVEGPRLPVGWVPEEHRKADWQLRSGCWKCKKPILLKTFHPKDPLKKCKLLLMEDVCKPQKAWFFIKPWTYKYKITPA